MASLGLKKEQLLSGSGPCVVNTGNSFLLIAVKDEPTVQAIAPMLPEIAAVSEELDLIGYYVFSRTTKRLGRVAGSRMFAPRFGIPEEAGTGMAAGPLASYLHDHLGVTETTMLIEQGWFMPEPSPSVIRVNLEIENGRIMRLMAGGKAKAITSRRVEV
jgi:PhzF family phenazine biosynthesis protein